MGVSKKGSDLTGQVNLALEGAARSWRSGQVLAGHEPDKVNNGYLQTYWVGRYTDMPVDIGIEWAEPKKISCIALRYLDSRSTPDDIQSRLQRWTGLQVWDGADWQSIEYELKGSGGHTHWYVFEPVETSKIRVVYYTPQVFTGSTFEWNDYPRGDLLTEEFRKAPIATGAVNLCSLEAYSETAVHQIDQLLIEPQPVRTFTDELTATLIVAETKWADQPVTAKQQAEKVVLENGFIRLSIDLEKSVKEVRLENLLCGACEDIKKSVVFELLIDEKTIRPQDCTVDNTEIVDIEDGKQIKIALSCGQLEMSLVYELKQKDHFYHKWLVIDNKSKDEIVVKDITLSSLGLPEIIYLHMPEDLSYPVSVLKGGGFFSCIEFPYWRHEEDKLTYYPGLTLTAGQNHRTESAAVGVYKDFGYTMVYMDMGIRQWVTEYHAHISPIGEEWPDRYHEAWDSGISMDLADTDPKWLEDYADRMKKLGVKYIDGWDPTHGAMVKPVEWIEKWTKIFRDRDILCGSWIDHGSRFAWGTTPEQLPFPCKMADDCQQYFKNVVDFAVEHKYRCMHHDFCFVYPCNDSSHGHLPGKYSLYPQAKALLEFDRQLHEKCPGMKTSGDGSFGSPQWTRLLDGRVHGVLYDYNIVAMPDIHIDRLVAEGSRSYVTTSTYVYLRPWFRTLNCVTHYGKATHMHDKAGFRYNLLSAIAVAPQVCFCDIPENMSDEEIAFTDKWLNWADENKDYFKQCSKLFLKNYTFIDTVQGQNEGIEGFAHIRGDNGFIFLINPSYQTNIASLQLKLDAKSGQQFKVTEIYPQNCELKTDDGKNYKQDDYMDIAVPARQIKILHIERTSGDSQQVTVVKASQQQRHLERYVGDWKRVSTDDSSITIESEFFLADEDEKYLSLKVEGELWQRHPWAYDKLYAVIILRNDTSLAYNGQMSKKMDIKMKINGVEKTVGPFMIPVDSSYNVVDDFCRCYFTDISLEAKPGQANKIELTIPKSRQGLTFKGIYIDSPEQMPYTLPQES